MKKFILLIVFVGALVCTLSCSNVAYAEISNPLCEIVFNSNGGTEVESQFVRVGQKVEKPNSPIDSVASEIFAGWYYLDNGNEVLWNFDAVVEKNMTLHAKWTNLECMDYSKLSQTLREIKPVEFYINTTEAVTWYVNGERQYGTMDNRFTFFTSEKGSYIISCRVCGVDSIPFVVAIDYYIPQELNVVMTVSQNNLYTFQIENGEYIDTEKCTWYCLNENSGAQAIGKGVKCSKKINKNCKVFVVYTNEITGARLFSRNITIEPEFEAPIIFYILIVVGACVIALVTTFVIISKKRYNDYY